MKSFTMKNGSSISFQPPTDNIILFKGYESPKTPITYEINFDMTTKETTERFLLSTGKDIDTMTEDELRYWLKVVLFVYYREVNDEQRYSCN